MTNKKFDIGAKNAKQTNMPLSKEVFQQISPKDFTSLSNKDL